MEANLIKQFIKK